MHQSDVTCVIRAIVLVEVIQLRRRFSLENPVRTNAE